MTPKKPKKDPYRSPVPVGMVIPPHKYVPRRERCSVRCKCRQPLVRAVLAAFGGAE